MKSGYRRALLLFLCFAFAFNNSSFTVAETLSHEYQPVEYTIGSEPIELWSPWIPVGVQILLRLKLGICLSAGSIQIKNPIKVTLDYDSALAKGGKTLKLKFKAQAISPNYNTFQSDFGINLPNKIQFGLASATGVGSLLPWVDVPYDFWDAIAQVPKVGEHISNAAQQIGVNMASQDALTIGTSKSFHDARDLISFNLADAFISDADKNRVGQKIMDRLPGKSAILGTISLATGKSSGEASQFLLEKCAGVLPAVAGKLATVSINGDPYYTVEGINVCLNVRYFVEGAGGGTKGSGTYPLYFTSDSQVKEINFGITPFINTGDKVKVIIDKITYEFKLTQDLQFNLGLSLLPSPAEHYTKLLRRTQASRDTTNEHTFSIPLQKSTDPIQLLDVHKGYTSAQVKFSSPYIALKTTVNVYRGTTTSSANKVKTVSESQFKNSHNIIVTDLTPNTQYSFLVDTVDASGTHYSGGNAITIRTLDSCPDRTFAEQKDELKFIGTPSATTGHSATDGYYIDFSWQTSVNATTMVYYSPSPDIAINYVAAIKRNNNTVTYGWATSDETPFELVKSHSLRAKNLEPGITYHYIFRSYSYENDNLSSNNYITIGKIASIATQAAPASPSVKVQVQGPGSTVVPNVIILISKTNDASYASTAITGTGGLTPSIMLDRNSTYKFSIKDHPGYQDAVSSNLSVAASATGELSNVILFGVKRPSPGGYVYGAQGNPIQGASASSSGRGAQTDNNGWYKIDGLSAGSHTLSIAKAGFLNASATGTVDAYGLFSATPCVLTSKTAVLNIVVRNSAGSPVSNASVAVKEGNTNMGSAVTTNSSGQATFNHEFSNTQTHNLTVNVTPPASGNLFAASENVSVAAGSTAKVDLICNQDTTGPTLSNIYLRQEQDKKLLLSFTASEPGQYSLEIIPPPPGSQITVPWTSMPNNGAVANLVIFHMPEGVPAGTFRVKIKVRDGAGNITETEFIEYLFIADATWDFRAESVTGQSAVLKWNKCPKPNEFTKYVIFKCNQPTGAITGSAVQTITNVNTTQYILSNLAQGVNYRYVLFVHGQNNALMGEPVELVFKTLVTAPVISNLRVNPDKVEVNKNVTVTANITDPDSKVRKVTLKLFNKQKQTESQITTKDYNSNNIQFSHTFIPTETGSFYVRLEAKDEAMSTAEEEALIVLAASGPTKEETAAAKAKEEAEKKALEEEKKAEAEKKTEEKKVEEPVEAGPAADVSVKTLELPKEPYLGRSCKVNMVVKNNSGSAVQKCYAFFEAEDGAKQKKKVSLTPESEKTVLFTWVPKKEGKQVITGSVECEGDENTKDNEISKKVVVKTTETETKNKASEEQKKTEETKTEETIEASPIDVSVKTLELLREPYLGRSCKVNMVVKNNSSSDVQGCYALFEAEDGSKRKIRISLKPESEKTVSFTWVPKKEGNQVINGSVECEGDENTKDNEISKKVVVKKVATEEGAKKKP